jgi:putative ribosome biogenesis GTPase RsgA
VDIQYLLFLVGKTNEAAHKIEGKEIILLLGNTGVGKSTTIHFLAGSRMLEEGDDILPVDARDDKLTDVHVEGGRRSVTRVITPTRITFEYDNEPISVFICDTPGFKDTEVDVANCIGLINAVRGVRSVGRSPVWKEFVTSRLHLRLCV